MANLDGTDIVHGERLLAQRSVGWKLVCSAWVLMVGVGFVFFSVLGWIWGAMLSRSRTMWHFTLMWGVLYGFAAYAMERLNDGTDLGVVIFLVIWMGSIAHAAYLSRGVLRARAVALAKDQGWRATAAQTAAPVPPPPPQPQMPTIPLPDGVRSQREDLRD
ncbi:hypothetical protein [Ornithinimicrobium pratense]|uniref:Uncharacterized protein n=1 Tax=Ornithinimicrobium pratense TaxID=2593973 RepID=A0A5J6V3Q8_9MICO|nr:hypothetical protein [Ornithinimicrobium pratense]QFG68519.1 hypothetical protein FY030_07130 [Ornithinimicrobium pratense]